MDLAYKAFSENMMFQLGQTMAPDARASAVSNFKFQLKEYLVGPYSPFRGRLWKNYLSSCVQKEPNRPDLFTLLECIVDYNFTDLHFFPIPLPSDAMAVDGQFYLTKIINLLAEHCPKLHDLSLKHRSDWKLTQDVEANYSQSFSRLKNLTHLQLGKLSTSDDCLQFFTHLGNSCLNLKSLRLINHHLYIGMKHLLALVLGEEVDQFIQKFIAKENEPENNLHLLQIPEDLVTPICRSLIKFEILCHSESEHNLGSKAHTSSMAFILRNMSRLQRLDVRNNDSNTRGASVSRAIQLLHESTQGSFQVPRNTNSTNYLYL